ncbi:hypothetical protein N780_13980 [Pontibacillus chungwhensis BH030062]|uniref:Uncharacterized protein n=2 Tax=Pontibacillus TaxID=289201 RepID=A0A0A2UX44_9BACI|nr:MULTISPECIES: hypothetical protein [Pontibacillus]KGP92499.1 hypothetical protein N780_13980 [Pontibacillus chungwhensis BH030062]QSS99890.1 hypothetical protein IMZ31_17800 [Pontibacillus sp. ALD_SL1]GGD01009.1 hypothetical protein GCM10011389_05330 [Pontibacillus salipaludis]
MKHPSQKFAQLQYLMLALAIFIGIISLMKDGWSILTLLMFYTLAFSFVFEGMAHFAQRNTAVFIEQALRAAIILLFSTILYF